MRDTYEWTCPDCDNATGGGYPEPNCLWCGQPNIIRNLTSEEAQTDHELMLEDQLYEILHS